MSAQPTLQHSRIVPGKNPREYFDPVKMAELETDIREHGIIEPIVVRPIVGDLYEIVAGERRWRAAGNVFGESYEMPVVIRDLSDEDAEALAMSENYHRDDMSAAEEAKGAQRLLLRNRGDKADTARMLGWSPTTLERRLALNACTHAVLAALTERRIDLGHAELLSGVPQDKQDSVLAAVIAGKVPVATLKAQLGRYARKLGDAIFDTAQCNGCPHNSARQAGLFGESLGEGYCQHPTHFEELTLQAVEAKAATLRDEYPVIRIVTVNDGFVPLPVAAEGELGVGERSTPRAGAASISVARCRRCRAAMARSPIRCASMPAATARRSPDGARRSGKPMPRRRPQRPAGQAARAGSPARARWLRSPSRATRSRSGSSTIATRSGASGWPMR